MFNLLDLLFPRSNARYSSISTYLTSEEISSLFSKLKPLTKNQSPYLEAIFVASPYEHYVIQDLLARLKQQGEYAISQSLGELIHQKIFTDADFFIPDPECIVPVPPDPVRLYKRGFSSQDLMARYLSKKIPNSLYLNLLRKSRSTPPQSELSKKQRLSNLKNTFILDSQAAYVGLSKAEILWLVDDITTTGTTLTECASTLKKHYPFLKIYGVAAAGN